MAIETDLFGILKELDDLANAPADDRSTLKSLRRLERQLKGTSKQLANTKAGLRGTRQSIRETRDAKNEKLREIAMRNNPGTDIITPTMLNEAKRDPEFVEYKRQLRKLKKQRNELQGSKGDLTSAEQDIRGKIQGEEARIAGLSPREHALEEIMDLFQGKGLGKKTKATMLNLMFRELDLSRQKKEDELKDFLAGSGRLRSGLLGEGLTDIAQEYGTGVTNAISEVEALNRNTRLSNRELGLELMKNFTKSELQQHFNKQNLAASKVALSNALGASQNALAQQLYFDKKRNYFQNEFDRTDPRLTAGVDTGGGFGSGFVGGFLPSATSSLLDIYQTKKERDKTLTGGGK